MIYGPRILNLRLCFMKGHAIPYTRSNLLISDQTYWLVIVILKLVIWMNRLDIRITIIQTVQNFVEFRPLKAELLLRQSSCSGFHLVWSVRKVSVYGLLGKNGWHRAGEPWIKINFWKLKSSAIAFSFAWFFYFLYIITFFYLL